MASIDLKRLSDLSPLSARKRQAVVGGRARGEFLRPYLLRLDQQIRKYPTLAKGVDRVTAVWRQLVSSFCEMVDPLLARFFPDTRLVAVVTDAGNIELHKITKDTSQALGALAGIGVDERETLGQTKWGAIELRLRPAQVLRRTLSLPGASRDFLGPILAHRLERLTPWRPEKALYGYKVLDTPEPSGAVNVLLIATSKDIIEDPVRRLSEAGLIPTRIGADDGALARPLDVDLLHADAASLRTDSHRFVSRAAMTVLSLLLVGVIASGWVASNAMDDQEAAAAKLLKGRRLLKSATMANIDGREKVMLEAKDPTKSTVVLIDRLAAAIPADTYLKELAVTPTGVRLVGSTRNAPALIGELEAAGLSNVRFSSAVTREKDQSDTFEITADRTLGPPQAEVKAR